MDPALGAPQRLKVTGVLQPKQVVRSATVEDAATLLAIYGPIVDETAISFEVEAPTLEAFIERIRLTMENDPWLVLEREGTIVGYAYATVFRPRPAYAATRETTVYIHPDHRGEGVGVRLMNALLQTLAAGGRQLAVAGIVLPNEGSVALHEKLGFRHVGTFHRVGQKFGQWHDVGFWERPLT